jgi:hypothetical protein
MKTPTLAIGLIAAAFGFVSTFGPRLFAEDKDCKISVQFKRVVMPVTKLSDEDKTALDGILKKYDKSLYKIVSFEKGVQVTGSEKGSLQDKYIYEEAEIMKAAEDSGDSGEGIQIGGEKCTPHCKDQLHNDDLVAAVEKLLAKYCPPKK